MRSIKRLSAAIVSAALISTATVVPTGSLLSAMAAEPVVSTQTANMNGLGIPESIDFGQMLKSATGTAEFQVTNIDKDLITLPGKTTNNGITVTFDKTELKKGDTAVGTVQVVVADVPATYDDDFALKVSFDNGTRLAVSLNVKVKVVDDLKVTLDPNAIKERDYGDDSNVSFTVTGGIRDKNGSIPRQYLNWVIDGNEQPVAANEIKESYNTLTITYAGQLRKTTTIKLVAKDNDGNTSSAEQEFVVKSQFKADVDAVDFGQNKVGDSIASKKVTLTNTTDKVLKPEVSFEGDFFKLDTAALTEVRPGETADLVVEPFAGLAAGNYQGEILASGLSIPVTLSVVDPENPDQDGSTKDNQNDGKQGFRKYLPWILLVLVILGLGAAAAPQLLPPPPAPPAP